MGKVKKLIREAEGQRDGNEINGTDCSNDPKDNNNLHRKKKKNNLTEKTFCCHVCDRKFKSKKGMHRHVRVVHEGYRFICRIDICYKFFMSKESLLEHRLIHTGERPLSCQVCNKTFRHRRVLQRHEAIHKGIKPHSCKVCERAFFRADNLRTHLKIHTGEKLHICELCQRGFARKWDLRTHFSVHVGEKLHICELCQRGFALKGNLRRHFRIHTGEKPFSCAYCRKKFNHKGNLRTHLVKCSGKNGFENQSKDHPSPQQSFNDENQTGDIYYGNLRKGNPATHLKTQKKKKPFSCAHCGTVFMKKRPLKFHLAKCFRDYGFENQFKDHSQQD